MREFEIKNFDKGLVTKIEDFSIPEGAASNSLNWLTLGDRVELSGGYKVIGTQQGAGKITGLATGELVNGDPFTVRTRGQKAEYYDNATDDWAESGSDLLGSDADGESTSITFYTSLAGYQTWLSSPNSGLFKIMNASPADPKDLIDSDGIFRGFIDAQNGRLHLWFREGGKNYLYGSYKDFQNSSVYTAVSGEAIGSAPGPSYSGNLAAVTGTRTCFGAVFTDGTQTAQDDKNGGFTGDATGTINYATGAYSITFNAVTTGAVTANYQWEDSKNNGLADFSFSATRTAGQGFFLPQSTGGDLLSVLPYRTEYYCLHENQAWLFSMPIDDLTPTNQVFRENLGLPSARAAVATGDGIYYIDTSNSSQPLFKLLTLQETNDQVVPVEFSFNLDLSGFDFSTGVAHRWGDYILFAGKTNGSINNNRVFAYNVIWRSFDVLDYQMTAATNREGALWSGESSTDNVTQLFTGFAADEALIDNFWEGKLSELQVDEIKKFKRLTLRGQIGASQKLKISLAYDQGGFTQVGLIEGGADYVDSSSVTVGSPQVGSLEVGGGGDGISAYNYTREFRVKSGRFREVKIRIEALSTGYASVSNINFYDIKTYGQKNIQRYRQTS